MPHMLKGKTSGVAVVAVAVVVVVAAVAVVAVVTNLDCYHKAFTLPRHRSA